MEPMDTPRVQAAAAPRLGRYEIDTDDSTVAFRSRHLFGLLPVRGTFAVRGGTVDVAEPLTASSVRVEIDAAGFRTGNDRRDEDVRSPRFLNAARYPLLTFASERVEDTAVVGTLTACGVSRPVRLAIGEHRVSQDGFTVRATARVDRTDFGVTAARGMAGRYLDLTVQVRCVRR